jgi:asparagine synthase (glutamine-hydrolysing)
MALQRVFRVDSPMNYFARSRAEATLPGRTMRVQHSRKLYPEAVDTSRYWYDISRETRQLELIDLYAAVHTRHTGPGGSLQKLRLVANAKGMSVGLPWCDNDVADYYFNMKERYRYDRHSGKNKLLLRRMLYRYLDYDADAVGKHYFEFDGARFLLRNDEYVRSEIHACSLWDSEGLDLVDGWLDRVESRSLLYHALLTIFMVSGWHNHSRFLARAG